jgi:hypothetical protein
MLGKVKGTTVLRACISLNWRHKGNIPAMVEKKMATITGAEFHESCKHYSVEAALNYFAYNFLKIAEVGRSA